MSIIFPISYKEPVFRPPSEAKSLLIQVTLGCSHNKCSFCAMYRTKKFAVRPVTDIKRDIELTSAYFQQIGTRPRSAFLCDGNALAAGSAVVSEVADFLNATYPKLSRISLYANARDILAIDDDELKKMAQKKVNLAFIGLESGSGEILNDVLKESGPEEMVAAAVKLRKAGIRSSIIVMLGIGGKEKSELHCRETAKVVSTITPDYLAFLTTTPVPGTSYHRQIEQGIITPLSTKELLHEIKQMLNDFSFSNEARVEFRANHVSNYLPLSGTLPKDQNRLAVQVDEWMREMPDNTYQFIDPRFL